MAKGIKAREEIPQEYKWDLERIYPNESSIEADIAKVKELLEKIGGFKGRLGDREVLLQCLQTGDEMGIVMGRLFAYAHMRLDEDRRVSKYQSLNDRVRALGVEVGEKTSFVEPELLKLDPNVLEEIIDDNRFVPYKMYFQEIARSREHVLSDAEERILASLGEVADAPSEIYSMLTNADIKFGTVKDSQGEEIEFSEGRAMSFFQSRDRRVRKDAYNTLYRTYTGFKNTLSQTLANNIKVNSVTARLRKYDSSIAMSLFPDNVPVQVYDNLIDTVSDNLQYLHEYVAMKKKMLGLDEMHFYDLYVPLVEDYDKEIKYEEAVETVKKGLASLGDRYIEDLSQGIANNWIDVYENQGKRSGAYSSGSYDTMPYILMNYDNKMSDLFTLAHELGHSMHSFYSNKKQHFRTAGYSIFVAEVASIFNETLLLKYLLNNAAGRDEKLYLLNYDLEGYRGTVFRQVMFAEFERIIHRKIDNGEALTPDVLCEEYYNLNKKYYGPEMTLDDNIAMEWSRIPHFYYNFYVYKYAIGFCAAKVLAQPIIEGDQEALGRYLSFLESGGSDYPLELLKKAGVDMSSREPVEKCMQSFKESLDRFAEEKEGQKG
jgi:oligoendopeptidase F